MDLEKAVANCRLLKGKCHYTIADVTKVTQLYLDTPDATMRSIGKELGISKSSVYLMLHDSVIIGWSKYIQVMNKAQDNIVLGRIRGGQRNRQLVQKDRTPKVKAFEHYYVDRRNSE